MSTKLSPPITEVLHLEIEISEDRLATLRRLAQQTGKRKGRNLEEFISKTLARMLARGDIEVMFHMATE